MLCTWTIQKFWHWVLEKINEKKKKKGMHASFAGCFATCKSIKKIFVQTRIKLKP